MTPKMTFTLPFPVLKIDLEIEYAPVAQPSGLEYVLLTLIEAYQGQDQNLREALRAYKIPQSLDFTVKETLEDLISAKAVKLIENNIEKAVIEWNGFKGINFKNLSLTSLGSTVAASGRFPSKEDEQSASLTLYLDMATGEYSTGLSSEHDEKNLEAGLYENPDLSDLSAAVESLKGSEAFPLNPSSLITDIKVKEVAPYGSFPYPGTIKVKETKKPTIEINFVDAEIQDFFLKHYNPETFEKALCFKSDGKTKLAEGFNLYGIESLTTSSPYSTAFYRHSKDIEEMFSLEGLPDGLVAFAFTRDALKLVSEGNFEFNSQIGKLILPLRIIYCSNTRENEKIAEKALEIAESNPNTSTIAFAFICIDNFKKEETYDALSKLYQEHLDIAAEVLSTLSLHEPDLSLEGNGEIKDLARLAFDTLLNDSKTLIGFRSLFNQYQGRELLAYGGISESQALSKIAAKFKEEDTANAYRLLVDLAFTPSEAIQVYDATRSLFDFIEHSSPAQIEEAVTKETETTLREFLKAASYTALWFDALRNAQDNDSLEFKAFKDSFKSISVTSLELLETSANHREIKRLEEEYRFLYHLYLS